MVDVFSGTIKNLNIADSYIKGERGTATFARFVHTGSKISNCSSSAIVDGTIYSGGIAGESRGIIENCYFTGKLTSTDITSSAIVSECTDEYYTENTVTNCYYAENCGLTSRKAQSKTTEEFANGEVCFLLNNLSSYNTVWYQNIGVDSYPVLDSTHQIVYATGKMACPDSTNGLSFNNTGGFFYNYISKS